MKKLLLSVLLFISLLSLPLEAKESDSVREKLPEGYQKIYSYEYGENYITRYEKSLPYEGSDPYDAYELILDKEKKNVKSLEQKYTPHPKLDEKKLISEERLRLLSEPHIKNPDSITLSVVEPPKLTPFQNQSTGKTEPRYAFLITKGSKTLYIDAYDEMILGLDEYEKSAPEVAEPESYVLKFWTWLKAWFH